MSRLDPNNVYYAITAKMLNERYGLKELRLLALEYAPASHNFIDRFLDWVEKRDEPLNS